MGRILACIWVRRENILDLVDKAVEDSRKSSKRVQATNEELDT